LDLFIYYILAGERVYIYAVLPWLRSFVHCPAGSYSARQPPESISVSQNIPLPDGWLAGWPSRNTQILVLLSKVVIAFLDAFNTIHSNANCHRQKQLSARQFNVGAPEIIFRTCHCRILHCK
jgi:hypothetical protein